MKNVPSSNLKTILGKNKMYWSHAHALNNHYHNQSLLIDGIFCRYLYYYFVDN